MEKEWEGEEGEKQRGEEEAAEAEEDVRWWKNKWKKTRLKGGEGGSRNHKEGKIRGAAEVRQRGKGGREKIETTLLPGAGEEVNIRENSPGRGEKCQVKILLERRVVRGHHDRRGAEAACQTKTRQTRQQAAEQQHHREAVRRKEQNT